MNMFSRLAALACLTLAITPQDDPMPKPLTLKPSNRRDDLDRMRKAQEKRDRKAAKRLGAVRK